MACLLQRALALAMFALGLRMVMVLAAATTWSCHADIVPMVTTLALEHHACLLEDTFDRLLSVDVDIDDFLR